MQKLTCLILFCFHSVFNFSQIKNSNKPVQQTKQFSQVKTPSSTNSNISNKFVLKVKTNVNCNVYLDGELKFLIKAGEVKKLILVKGKFELLAKPIQCASCTAYEDILTVTENEIGSEDIYEITVNKVLNKDETIAWILDKLNNSFAKGTHSSEKFLTNYKDEGYRGKLVMEVSYLNSTVEYDKGQNKFIFHFLQTAKSFRMSKESKVTFSVLAVEFDKFIIKETSTKITESTETVFPLPIVKCVATCNCIKNTLTENNITTNNTVETFDFIILTSNASDNVVKLNKAFSHLKEIIENKPINNDNSDFNN